MYSCRSTQAPIPAVAAIKQCVATLLSPAQAACSDTL